MGEMAHLHINGGYFSFQREHNCVFAGTNKTRQLASCYEPQSSCGWEIFKWLGIFWSPPKQNLCKFSQIIRRNWAREWVGREAWTIDCPHVILWSRFVNFLEVEEEVDTFRCNAGLWHFWHRFQISQWRCQYKHALMAGSWLFPAR